jgi:NAD(P)H dehydrogenase (quinone)
MKVLVIYAHPVETSFQAAVHAKVLEGLAAAGHEVDNCDLYAEGFNPVMSRQERLDYHKVGPNRAPVERYVERLLSAEGLVLVYPVWNFGFPAMLKGFFDRVFLPGISFKLRDGRVRPNLHNIRKLAAVTTYGSAHWRAFILGDGPRKAVTRVVRVVCHPSASCDYCALYDMNRATDEDRAAFLSRVHTRMARF